MKLIVFLLITLAVFSDEEHRDQEIIEKSYFHDLKSDFIQNPYDLIRDFQLHCDSSEESLIEVDKSECLEILNDGKSKGFSDSEAQCVFTYKIDSECMDEYIDNSDSKEEVSKHVVKGTYTNKKGKSSLLITIGWNNIKKFIEDPLDGNVP